MEMLFPWLAAPSDGPALRVGERGLSQSELAAACAGHVARLVEQGVEAGARIGVWTQPALETLVALVAHAAAGYVSVPLDPKLGAHELGHVVRDAAPRLAVAADAGAIAERMAALPDIAITTIATTLAPGQALAPGEIATTLAPGQALAPGEIATTLAPGQALVPGTIATTLAPGQALVPRAIAGEPALILYTSGTTGPPKGAIITDRNIASNLDMLARAWAWTAEDVIVHALPMFHVHGLVLGLFGSLRRGGMLRWVPRFTPEELAAAVRDHEPAVVFAVPTMYHRLCEATAPEVAEALRGARLLVSGSAPLSTREHRSLEAMTGQRVIERYGLTETLINCSTRHDGDRRAGVVGPPLEGVELRLVDDARQPIGDGETTGEIAVRGPHVFAGYLNRDDATRAVLDADGWFYTGDVATRADDGQLSIVGRRSTDIIKCGGFKVGAGEVEAALLEHPAVSAAAVIGKPDADLGERIVAFVVVRAPVEVSELEQHVASRLSPHKRPREVHFLDDLPRNAMGKVQKVALKSR